VLLGFDERYDDAPGIDAEIPDDRLGNVFYEAPLLVGGAAFYGVNEYFRHSFMLQVLGVPAPVCSDENGRSSSDRPPAGRHLGDRQFRGFDLRNCHPERHLCY
jgi:hypothetical protein